MIGTKTNGKVPKSDVVDSKELTSNNSSPLDAETHRTQWAFINTPLGRGLHKLNPLRSLSEEGISRISNSSNNARSSNNLFKNCLLWCGGVHWNCQDLSTGSAKNRVPKALVSIIISSFDGSIIGVAAASIFPPLSGILIGVGISIGEISYNRHVFSKQKLSFVDVLLRLIPGIAIASATSLFLPIFMSNRVVENTIKVEIEEQLIKTRQERKIHNNLLYKVDIKKSEETGKKEFYKDDKVQDELEELDAKIKRLESKLGDLENGNLSNSTDDIKLSIEEKAKILFNSAFIPELEREQAQFYEDFRKKEYQNNSLDSSEGIQDNYPRERRAWEKIRDVNFYRTWSIYWFVVALFIESTPMLMQIKTKDEENDSYEETIKWKELKASSQTFFDYEADKISKVNQHAPLMDDYVTNSEAIANARVLIKRFENAEKELRFVGDNALKLEQKHNYSSPLEEINSYNHTSNDTPTMARDVDKPFDTPDEHEDDSITNDFKVYREIDSPNKSDTPQQNEQPMSLREQLNKWSEDNANQYSSEEDDRDREEYPDPWLE
ncbi:MAG: hypothetical protein AB4206_09000 [Xenococcaceae cyanobacterium]